MKDIKTTCKIALVQAEPVMFSKSASLKKALQYICEAASQKPDLIVFPELFIPGYPVGMNFGFSMGKRSDEGRKDWKRYYDASVVAGDSEFQQLAEAAKKAEAYISLGFSERDAVSGTLYNSNVIFEPNGSYKVHRKLKPTGSERVVWGDANKDYFPVTETPWGPIGSMICWESYMPLARVALYQKGITIYISPNTNDNPEWQATIQHIAIEGKCFFVMGTAPNSGKSTLGEFLQKTLGSKLVTSKSIAQIPGRFSMGDIQGKLLNLSLDLPKGKFTPIVVSIIKQITGGDSISIERKYDKLRDIHSTIRFLFASNYPVTISRSDEDDAFWARMIVIPFLYTIEKEDADTELSRKLLQEKDDIISICLRALSNVVNNHYIFSPCEAADKIKERWRYQECDSIESIPLFVEEYLEVTGEPTDMVYSRQLYEIYCNFCEESDFSPLRYHTFISWFCSNINGCSTKRRHETGKNPMAALTGIRVKQWDD